MKIIFILLISFYCITSEAQSTNKQHPEHFIGGMVIGGVTSYFVYKKTNNKVKSWAIGTGASVLVGLAKEVIDSAVGKNFSGEDLGYTALGGAIGASIVFPLKKKKPKEVAYLF
jgi:hypothetical protein